MKIEIKSKSDKARVVLFDYSKMKHRGVSNTWDEEKEILNLVFPKLSNVDKVKSAYVEFLEQTLKDNGLEKKEYEINIK